MLTPPLDGLYFLSLTVTVNRDHYVTVALRQGGQTILRLTAGSDAPFGQATGSLVVSLSRNEAVKVQVEEFSPGAVLLTSPSTFFSGYLIG